ncbi:hypothetical protein P168DRAFT_20022 [Aspergillus campestris IBT 28561]|uniref:Uncharacterized protein n=1 Tax=Aspergillus campestris (strain IBT 28561) TaxID=1392248 RepID=A0A2I1DFI6_ASPC2|nr:uncharacterized protein P168DRAFT_20022 [Aspergillus campestris IBT 28561]PKY08620.1 hypothetical protein P168DRAFT_20022 [Aspergillus campestris IBT 28561]
MVPRTYLADTSEGSTRGRLGSDMFPVCYYPVVLCYMILMILRILILCDIRRRMMEYSGGTIFRCAPSFGLGGLLVLFDLYHYIIYCIDSCHPWKKVRKETRKLNKRKKPASEQVDCHGMSEVNTHLLRDPRIWEYRV